MNDQLPISIKVHHDLIAEFSRIQSVCNKLEAQLNFQTLTANWYGDEETILTIQLFLESTDSFIKCQSELLEHNKLKHSDKIIKQFSDDVICGINETALQLQCFVAMTESELELLTLQPKLLAGLIQAKLTKVLNLIAEQQSLTKI